MTVTKDILDNLAPDFDTYMSISDDKHHKLSERNMKISPKYWQSNFPLIDSYEYDWIEVKYTDLKNHLDAKPESANGVGVYLFVVRPDVPVYGLPGYVYYVGIAGETVPGRHLSERLKEYLSFSQVKKREAVHNSLQYYYKHTYVIYSKVNLPPTELRELEEALHGFYYPWAGKRDFPPKIKDSQKAWGGV